jgi:hypothetical protein
MAERETAIEHGLDLAPGDASSARVQAALRAEAYRDPAHPEHAAAVAAALRERALRGGAQEAEETAAETDEVPLAHLRHELGGITEPPHLSPELKQQWAAGADAERQVLQWARGQNLGGQVVQRVFDLYGELGRLGVAATSEEGVEYFRQHARGLSAGQIRTLIAAAQELGL